MQVLVLNGKRKRCCGNHDTDSVDLLRCLGGGTETCCTRQVARSVGLWICRVCKDKEREASLEIKASHTLT